MRTDMRIKWVALILSLWMLSGCGKKGWFRDRSQDYSEAKTYPSLQIPTNVHAERFSSEYQIPETSGK